MGSKLPPIYAIRQLARQDQIVSRSIWLCLSFFLFKYPHHSEHLCYVNIACGAVDSGAKLLIGDNTQRLLKDKTSLIR